MKPPLCPDHGSPLAPSATRFGTRWACVVAGCTVSCWDGDTSTPADAETRALRTRCHDAFDPLWRRRTRFRSRGEAYRWLRRAMNLTVDEAHVGRFDAAQCRRLLALLGEESR